MDSIVRFDAGNSSPTSLPFDIERLSGSKKALSFSGGEAVAVDSICIETGLVTTTNSASITFDALTGHTYNSYKLELINMRLCFLAGESISPMANEPTITPTQISKAKRLIRDNQNVVVLTHLTSDLPGRIAIASLLGYLPLPDNGSKYKAKTRKSLKASSFADSVWYKSLEAKAHELDATLHELTKSFLPFSAGDQPSIVTDHLRLPLDCCMHAHEAKECKSLKDLIELERNIHDQCNKTIELYSKLIDPRIFDVDLDLIPFLVPENTRLAKHLLETHFRSIAIDLSVLPFYWPAIFEQGLSPTAVIDYLKNSRTYAYQNLANRQLFQAACAKFNIAAGKSQGLASEITQIASSVGLTLTTDKDSTNRWLWSLSNGSFIVTAITSDPWTTGPIIDKAKLAAYADIPADTDILAVL